MLFANLMFGNVSVTQLLVAGLRLGVLRRAGVGVARAGGRRAEVAVEQRVLAAVAVHVDAPASCGGRVRVARGRAVVGQRLALRAGVVHRVVRAVRVGVRRDEDLDVVQELLGLRVGRVVLDQLVRRLHAGEAGGPLASVLLAEQEDARLGAVTVRADAVQVLLERTARDARGSVEEVRQVDARARPRRCRRPRCRGRWWPYEQRGGLRIGVDRGDDLGGRRARGAGGVRGEEDLDELAVDLDAERQVRCRLWLRNSAMTWLPPSWPQSLAVSTTARSRRAAEPGRLDLEREVAEVALEARDLEGVGAGRR